MLKPRYPHPATQFICVVYFCMSNNVAIANSPNLKTRLELERAFIHFDHLHLLLPLNFKLKTQLIPTDQLHAFVENDLKSQFSILNLLFVK